MPKFTTAERATMVKYATLMGVENPDAMEDATLVDAMFAKNTTRKQFDEIASDNGEEPWSADWRDSLIIWFECEVLA